MICISYKNRDDLFEAADVLISIKGHQPQILIRLFVIVTYRVSFLFCFLRDEACFADRTSILRTLCDTPQDLNFRSSGSLD